MAQLDARPTGDQEVGDSTPVGRQQSFVEIDHEIFSTVADSRTLVSFLRKICTILVYCLED